MNVHILYNINIRVNIYFIYNINMYYYKIVIYFFPLTLPSKINMYVRTCVFSSLALPSEGPGDILRVIGVPGSRVFDSEYNYLVNEAGFLGEMTDSRVW